MGHSANSTRSEAARRRKNRKYLLRALPACSRCRRRFLGPHFTKGYGYCRCCGSIKGYFKDGKTAKCHGVISLSVVENLIFQEVEKFVLEPQQLRKREDNN